MLNGNVIEAQNTQYLGQSKYIKSLQVIQNLLQKSTSNSTVCWHAEFAKIGQLKGT